ncbi:sporulation protein [Novipirellula sp.]|uniref:sporulation protein n=1 Tax=Novipirellula sp. TaxID=2795430 RepID=UPI003563D005
MAKCDLSIELAEGANFLYEGGGTVRGKVRVNVDQDVKCSGLVVESVWKTHGRGNVTSGTFASTTLFQGEWVAGQVVEYPFELPVGDWPPSYHGHYLNVDHYIDARVKIPWGFDPKASVPILMRPTCGPEAAVTKKAPSRSVFAGIFIGVFLMIWCSGFMFFMVQNPFSLICVGIFPVLFAVGYAIKVLLPKYLLGEVVYEVSPTVVAPGDQVKGELVLRPRKNVNVNAITLNFEAREVCVSGSGSNKTTHKHVFFERTTELQSATTLAAGQERRFPILVTLPEDAPYTLDLPSNDLIWATTLRIDIPRWPDWSKEIALQVLPSGKPMERPVPSIAQPAVRDNADGITFAETANHLWSLRDEPEQLATLVDAVTGLSFRIEAFVERRLLYAGDEDPHVFKDGYAVWAHYGDPPLPLVLYVPHQLADDFEQIGRDRWVGQGTIVGWDDRHRRLQIKLDTE